MQVDAIAKYLALAKIYRGVNYLFDRLDVDKLALVPRVREV